MPVKYEGGVRFYTTARAAIRFPERDIICRACPLLGLEYGLKREYCKLSGEYIPDADYCVGSMCPLSFDYDELERREVK